jgi:hypothetical protein
MRGFWEIELVQLRFGDGVWKLEKWSSAETYISCWPSPTVRLFDSCVSPLFSRFPGEFGIVESFFIVFIIPEKCR